MLRLASILFTAMDTMHAQGQPCAGSCGPYNSAASAEAVVLGGSNNEAVLVGATVAGGDNNRAIGANSAVGGGELNEAQGNRSFIGSGMQNAARATDSTVGGGRGNEAKSVATTVAGGLRNSAFGEASAVGGGSNNNVYAEGGVISGGANNSVNGKFGAVVGGLNNQAQGDYSLAAGVNANARDNQAVFEFANGIFLNSGRNGGPVYILGYNVLDVAIAGMALGISVLIISLVTIVWLVYSLLKIRLKIQAIERELSFVRLYVKTQNELQFMEGKNVEAPPMPNDLEAHEFEVT
eukprot:g70742.t1